MTDSVAISLIIPAYNEGSTVGKVIDKVLLQEMVVEIIVIDD